ncbi:MAG: response regulator [Candidatus Eremiobacteraeota bacterium]|nr:response regulator [Candidatus Eremiobacteraeota bacterium]MCW5871351.1 response regulator [Candidatus Eremiobacteraeota bacterium]
MDQLPLVIFRRSAQKDFEMQYLSSRIVQQLHSPLNDLLGSGFDRLVHGEDQASLRATLERGCEQEGAYRAAYRLDRQWVTEFGQRDGQHLIGHLHFGLTRQAEPERRQLDLERKLRSIFESPEVMTVILTPEGLIYAAGPALRAHLGDHLRGQSLQERLREHRGEAVAERFGTALRLAGQGSTQSLELEWGEADFQVTISPIAEDHQLQFYYVNWLDITQRNANRDYMRQSEQNLQDLFQATAAAMLVVRAGKLVQCNPAALQLLGAGRADEVVGRSVREFLSNAQESGVFESELQRLDGNSLQVEVTITPLLFAGRSHLLYGCYNLTAQKNIQEALQAAMETAENANRAKSSFLATMSHEIRTPLNGIIGLLHLARQSPQRERQLDYLEKLERAAQGLLRIINDVLDFSKIEAGQLHLEIDDFELDGVLDQVTHMISVWSKDKPDLHSHFDVQPGLPRKLRGDSLRLTQILMNLCSNAVKFTQQGEVTVSVRRRAQDDSTVLLEFCVSDTGIGMSDRQLERTFVPFSQADSSTTRIYGGTGLGLFITKRFVELLGGSIGVESRPGEGSRFTFTARFALTQASASPELQGLRVLVLDENDASRQNFQGVLGRLGCHYQLLKSAEQALYLAAEARFQVVVLDGRLEQVDEIFECLKLHEGLKDALFLRLARLDELAGAYRQGFDGVMTKPVSETSFSQAVEAARLRRSNNQAITDGLDRRWGEGHVLLVEDNDINQEVAREILRLFGLRVTLATTGQEALEALERESFDLVLMDLQMPEMDGLEATRRARGLGHRLPIVAMTANARREDRELCLAAGMDDYLSKPINPEALAQLLRQYLQAGSPPEPEPVVEEADFPAVDGVNCQAGLSRLGGNRRLYRSLLLQFARRQAGSGARLAAAQGEELRALVHTIKGAAANLGAEILSAHCHLFEEGRLEIGVLRQELERVVEAALGLEEVDLSRQKSGKVLNQAKVSSLLSRLRDLLEHDLGEAFVTLDEVVQEMEGTALAPQAVQLKVWMEEFEVDRARALVDELI